MKDDGLSLWDFESNSTFFPIIDAIARFIIWNVSAVTIVSRCELELFLFFSKRYEPLRTTETIVRTPLFAELVKSRRIFVESFALNIWSISSIMMRSLIRHDTQDRVNIEYGIDGSFHETSSIRIFDSEYIASTIMLCPEVGIECGTNSSDMRISCR